MGLRIETMNVIKIEVILWYYHPNWAPFVEIENSKEKQVFDSSDACSLSPWACHCLRGLRRLFERLRGSDLRRKVGRIR